MRPFSKETFMNIKTAKLDFIGDKQALLAGGVLLILAIGFMVFKLSSLQSQVSGLEANRKVLQTVPPSQQVTREAAEKIKILEDLRKASPQTGEVGTKFNP